MLSSSVLFAGASCLLALPLATAAPTASEFALFETHRAPPSFTRLDTPPHASHPLTLHIGLTQPHNAEVEELALAVSDPNHPHYGQFLDDAQLAALTQPHSNSIDAVAAWLESHGLSGEWSASKDWVVVPGVQLEKVEKMIDAQYSVYRHDDGDVLIRTEAWSLPVHLHKHIELIQPTTMFGRLHPHSTDVFDAQPLSGDQLVSFKASANAPTACTNPTQVPNLCLRQLYHTDKYVPKAPKQNSLGITGYIGEYAQYSDLAMFLKAERPDQIGYKFEVQLAPGGSNPQGLNASQVQAQQGIEANLDVQTAAGFTAPTKNIFYSTPGSPPFIPDAETPTDTNEPYLTWLTYIQSLPISKVPKVITTSYGDSEQTVPRSYANRVCDGFRNLGVKGVSMIFSSGDFGVGKDGTCFTNDGKNKTHFLPNFPASCPWVTSVGGTEQFSPEVAVSAEGAGGYFAGGGFSNYFERPDYQEKDASKYVAGLKNKYDGLYNKGGRGIPDVSAQGAKYVIAWDGRFVRVGGTSASGPTFASVVTLLNDYRISQKKPTLGFLNPWLYKTGRKGLNDILSGSSAGCNTTGFAAGHGWDPVTGLGTPDFLKLQKLLPNA